MIFAHAYYALWSFETLENNIRFCDWSLTVSSGLRRWGGGYALLSAGLHNERDEWCSGYYNPFGFPKTPIMFPCTYGHKELYVAGGWPDKGFSSFYDVYSPNKIDSYVLNPQLKTTAPSSQDYNLYYESDPQQAIKNHTGDDVLYSNFVGVKYADIFGQKLRVLNALRYSDKHFDLSVNVKSYRREKDYNSSGSLTSDTGWVVTDLADGTGMNTTASYRKYKDSNNVIRSRVEQYYTCDIDMSRFDSVYDIDSNLIDVVRAYLYEHHTIDGSEYDGSITTIQDGMSIINRVSGEPSTIPDQGGTYIREKRFYRFATSLKEMTFEDLANHYQVPY